MAARRTIPLLFATALLLPVQARAEDPARVEVSWSVRHDRISADFDVSQAFDEETASQLQNGLTNRVRITLELHALDADGEAKDGPVSVVVRECEIVYDLWGERFGLRITDDGRTAQHLVQTYAEVVSACARFEAVPLAPVGALDLRRRYTLEVRFVLNPEERREEEESESDYVGDPLGHRRGGEQGATLFGAMARLFVRDPPEADGALRTFRSPPFGEETIRRALHAPKPRPPVRPVSTGEEEEE